MSTLRKNPTSAGQHETFVDGRQRFARVRICNVIPMAQYAGVGDIKAGGRTKAIRLLNLFLRVYIYSTQQNTFLALPNMPVHLPVQIREASHGLHLISQGATWGKFNSMQRAHRPNFVLIYGNRRRLYETWELVKSTYHHAGAPLFGLQYLGCIYLVYRNYWIFPLLLALLSLAANLALVFTLRLRHTTTLGLIGLRRIIPIVQQGWVKALPAYKLVPGDVIVVQAGKVSCDMVLLRGSCLVEEAMLSGEAAQVRKSSYMPDPKVDYDPESYHTCTVYAGTVVQQVWNTEDQQEEVLAMVVRMGLNSCMGGMIRELIAPAWQRKDKISLVKDALKLYAFSLFLQLLILIPYAVKAAHFGQTARNIVDRVFDALVRSAPPAAPTAMLFCGAFSRGRLKAHDINLTFPAALGLAGETSVVCFDKTGTLTGNLAELHGVVPACNGRFEALQQSAVRWSNRLKQAIAVCNGLTFISQHSVVGNDLERKLFKTVEARFQDRQTVVLPRQSDADSALRTAKLAVLKVFEFNSQNLKSGVVVTANDTAAGTGLVFVKGAHTAIQSLVLPAALPPDFDQVVDEYSRKSFRLMALAVGKLPRVHQLDLTCMSQQQVEARAEGFQLLGLIVVANQVRQDSKNAVIQLQHRAHVRTMMITGDYHHTALAVARDVTMVEPDSPIMIIDAVKDVPTLPSHCLQLQGLMSKQIEVVQSSSHMSALQPSGQSWTHSLSQSHAQKQSQCDREALDHALGHTSCGQEHDQLSTRSSSLPQDRTRIGMSQLGQDVSALTHGQTQAVPHRSSARQQPCISAPQPVVLGHAMTQGQSATLRKAASAAYHSAGGAVQPARLQSGLGSNKHVHYDMPSSPSSARLVLSAGAPWGLLGTPNSLLPPSAQPAAAGALSSQDGGLPALAKPDSPSWHAQFVESRLRFVSEGVQGEWEGKQALNALAEGQLRCAVTGDAFQLLLQLPDESVLRTVMQSAVVFARMQPHQKAQVVSLLNMRGIYQASEASENRQRHIEGLQQTVLFCGDGINDLSALAAADVGYAVGATEASAAAAVSTTRCSIAGVCDVIRVGKCSHALLNAMFKYMIQYQSIIALAQSIMFFVDGSSYSVVQAGASDFVAVTLALTAASCLPRKQLYRDKPAVCMSTRATFLQIAVSTVLRFGAQAGVAALLCSQSWFTGGTGNADQNPVNSALWLSAIFQLIMIPFSLVTEVWPFCESLLSCKPFLLLESAYVITVLVGVFVGPFHHANAFSLFFFPENFRLQQLGILAGVGVLIGFSQNLLGRPSLCMTNRHQIAPM